MCCVAKPITILHTILESASERSRLYAFRCATYIMCEESRWRDGGLCLVRKLSVNSGTGKSVLLSAQALLTLTDTGNCYIMVLKLALLLCDTPHPKVVEKHGDYRTIFRDFLKNSLLPNAAKYEVDDYDVVHEMEYPSDDKIDQYAGIILTGSGTHTKSN